MYKKEKCSKRAISTIEIVSSYFVNIYYNCLYQEGKKFHIDSRVDSVTSGYKHAIKAYINSFDNPDLYRKIISGIHKYYHNTTRFTSISFSDCINEIVKHFIPESFFESTTNSQKDSILRMILFNSVKKFSSDILCSDMLSIVIDNHADHGITRRLQDTMVNALIFEREKMFQKIFSTSTDDGDSDNYAIATRLKQELVKMAREKYIAECKQNKMKSKLMDLIKIAKEYQTTIQNLQLQLEMTQKEKENLENVSYNSQNELQNIVNKQLQRDNENKSTRIQELEINIKSMMDREKQIADQKEAKNRKKRENANQEIEKNREREDKLNREREDKLNREREDKLNRERESVIKLNNVDDDYFQFDDNVDDNYSVNRPNNEPYDNNLDNDYSVNRPNNEPYDDIFNMDDI